MAELTNLESKLGEVTGLAMAAKVATSTVAKLARKDHKELVAGLKSMAEEAAETEGRCKQLAGTFNGKEWAIFEEAKATKEKGASMLEIYLDEDSDTLDGFEFLTMAEAGEVGHWEVLQNMAKNSGRREIVELVRWALPIQRRHLEAARSTSGKLASEEDPER